MEITLQKLIDLSNKTAIVTGGAMGIGKAIINRLAEAGANVVIADMNGDAIAAAVGELTQKGRHVLGVKVDVSQRESVQAMISAVVEKFGGIDILVNNAGIYPNIPVMQMQDADFERIIEVNLKGVYLTTQTVGAQMITQGRGGRIINVTSIDAIHPSMIGLATYDASKHGVWGFTKNSALELAPHKIWVNAVAPGGIATPGTGVQEGQKPSKEMEEMLAPFLVKIPMKRMGDPDDIGKVVLFLASDMATYMTGSQIVVDGGYLLS